MTMRHPFVMFIKYFFSKLSRYVARSTIASDKDIFSLAPEQCEFVTGRRRQICKISSLNFFPLISMVLACILNARKNVFPSLAKTGSPLRNLF